MVILVMYKQVTGVRWCGILINKVNKLKLMESFNEKYKKEVMILP